MEYLIVGLGNPGEKYTNTRHNVAWIILRAIFKDNWHSNKYILAHHHRANGYEVVLPTTFMNASGNSVNACFEYFSGMSSENLIVIYDDLDLELGVVKVSFDRGQGGHNGLSSITNSIKTRKFIRIRIGISIKDDNSVLQKPPVLGIFQENEYSIITQKVSPKVKDILETIKSDGYEKAMNIYNTSEQI